MLEYLVCDENDNVGYDNLGFCASTTSLNEGTEKENRKCIISKTMCWCGDDLKKQNKKLRAKVMQQEREIRNLKASKDRMKKNQHRETVERDKLNDQLHLVEEERNFYHDQFKIQECRTNELSAQQCKIKEKQNKMIAKLIRQSGRMERYRKENKKLKKQKSVEGTNQFKVKHLALRNKQLTKTKVKQIMEIKVLQNNNAHLRKENTPMPLILELQRSKQRLRSMTNTNTILKREMNKLKSENKNLKMERSPPSVNIARNMYNIGSIFNSFNQRGNSSSDSSSESPSDSSSDRRMSPSDSGEFHEVHYCREVGVMENLKEFSYTDNVQLRQNDTVEVRDGTELVLMENLKEFYYTDIRHLGRTEKISSSSIDSHDETKVKTMEIPVDLSNTHVRVLDRQQRMAKDEPIARPATVLPVHERLPRLKDFWQGLKDYNISDARVCLSSETVAWNDLPKTFVDIINAIVTCSGYKLNAFLRRLSPPQHLNIDRIEDASHTTKLDTTSVVVQNWLRDQVVDGSGPSQLRNILKEVLK